MAWIDRRFQRWPEAAASHDDPRCQVSVAPLVPVVLAMAAGIVADRYGDSLETSDWITLALAAITAAAVCVRSACDLVRGICAAVMALGAPGTITCGLVYALDDLGWSVTETPRPAWVRGRHRPRCVGTRMSQGYGPGDPERIVTRMVMEIDRHHRRQPVANGLRARHGGRWRQRRSTIHAGQPVEAAGQLSRIAGPLNPGEFDYRALPAQPREFACGSRSTIPRGYPWTRAEPDSAWHRWLGDSATGLPRPADERASGTRTAPAGLGA